MSPERLDSNYLRLFNAVIAFFEAVQKDGSVEPRNTPFLLKAFDELMRALGIDRKRTWKDNYQRLGIIERTGKHLQYLAKGALEFLEPANRKGKGAGLYLIESALVVLWRHLNNAERIALNTYYEKALLISRQLPPLLAFIAFAGGAFG
jgi:hypothetical protein